MQLLSQGHVKPGQPIDVAKWADSDLWLELDLEPSLAGRAVTFLYRAPAVDLRVWCAANNILRQAKFRSPAPMLSTGFVASPLLLDDQDVLDLYTGKPVARPVAYSVALARGTSFCWKHNVGFRLYKIERQLGHSASPELTQLMKYPGFEVAPAAIVASTNAWLKLLGKPALYLPPGSYMRIPVPDDARFVKGGFGLAAASYSFGGNTEGADFRIEEMFPDGHMQLLHSRILRPRTNPDDRGLQIFSVPCPGQGERQLLFRILPLANNPSPSDLTCWAEIGFR